MFVARWSLTNTDPELSRVQPSSGKFLMSYPVKRWVPPHLPTVPKHRFRESSQMAAHDSFASSGPLRMSPRPDRLGTIGGGEGSCAGRIEGRIVGKLIKVDTSRSNRPWLPVEFDPPGPRRTRPRLGKVLCQGASYGHL